MQRRRAVETGPQSVDAGVRLKTHPFVFQPLEKWPTDSMETQATAGRQRPRLNFESHEFPQLSVRQFDPVSP